VSWLIIAAVAGGIFLGSNVLQTAQIEFISGIAPWTLYLVLLTIGFGLAQDRAAWRRFGRLGWRVLLMPLATIVGTLLGVVLIAPLAKLTAFEALSIGAGFGWYSLSGVLLSSLGYSTLGAIAFLSNVFRELLAVVTIPWLAKKTDPFLAIAPGGATTMDTTLSLLSRYGTNESVLTALINGIILSTAVPLLVPLFANMIGK
jgi:uncharacterized membrane protein YbjE (DUF340 family)